MMEYVACAVCGAMEHDVLLDKLWLARQRNGDPRNTVLHINNEPVNYRNVCCRNCGLVFINPRLSEQESIEFYATQYRELYTQGSHSNPSEGSNYPFTREHLGLEIYNAVIRHDFLEQRELLRTALRCLDIGSSLGALPAYLRAKNIEAYGLEISPFGLYTKELFGVDCVYRQPVEQFDRAEKYDVITLCDVLEHLANPVRVLRRIREWLTENGVLLIEVPDIFKPHKTLMGFFSNAHLYTYSPTSIMNLLAVCGLEVDHLEYGGYCKNMRVIAHKSAIGVPSGRDTARVIAAFMTKYNAAHEAYLSFKKGQIDYESAMAIVDHNLPGHNAIPFAQALRCIGKGDYKNAEEYLLKCLRDDFNEEGIELQVGNLYGFLAIVSHRGGSLDRSRQYLSKAKRLMPRLYDFPYLDDLKRRAIFDMDEFAAARNLTHRYVADLDRVLTVDATASTTTAV